MNRTVVAELLGQLVPLAARPSAVDDPVERTALVDPRASGAFWGIETDQNAYDDGPEIVRNAPDGGQSVLSLPGHMARALHSQCQAF
jgi:hypothetical protein